MVRKERKPPKAYCKRCRVKANVVRDFCNFLHCNCPACGRQWLTCRLCRHEHCGSKEPAWCLGCGAILTLGDMTKPKANGGVDGVVENTLPDIQKNQKSQSR